MDSGKGRRGVARACTGGEGWRAEKWQKFSTWLHAGAFTPHKKGK